MSLDSPYSTIESIPKADTSKIKSVRYPLLNDSLTGDTHYVRFYINLNEESSLIKTKYITTEGVKDNSEQMRVNRNSATNSGVAAAAGVAGVVIGAQYATKSIQKMFSGKTTTKPQLPNVIVAGTGAAIAAGVVGTTVGLIAANSLNISNKIMRLKASITLYAPDNIKTTTNIEYDMPTDIMLDLMQQDQFGAIAGSLDKIGAAPVSGNSLAGNVAGAISGTASIAGKAARIAASTNSTISMATRTAVNKKRDVMFKSVGNREFQFTYVFAPKSAKEAQEVADIIYMFRYFSHPEMMEGYGNFLYIYPAEFDIEYGIRRDGKESRNDKLNKISSCVLQNIDINYAPNGSYQSLANGEPVMTTMTLSFKEIETLHQARIEQGY